MSVANGLSALVEAYLTLGLDLRDALSPPCRPYELDVAEEQIGLSLPIQVRELYGIANGLGTSSRWKHPAYPTIR